MADLRIVLEQLAVRDHGAVEVPGEELLERVPGGLAVDREQAELRSGARVVPTSPRPP